jgi:NAD-dependent dihydropyrimidine dehydrogenase PreA subunit
MSNQSPIINLERCDRCGICVSLCPFDALEMTNRGPMFKNPDACTYCAKCEELCPRGAIRAPYTITWYAENQPG